MATQINTTEGNNEIDNVVSYPEEQTEFIVLVDYIEKEIFKYPKTKHLTDGSKDTIRQIFVEINRLNNRLYRYSFIKDLFAQHKEYFINKERKNAEIYGETPEVERMINYKDTIIRHFKTSYLNGDVDTTYNVDVEEKADDRTLLKNLTVSCSRDNIEKIRQELKHTQYRNYGNFVGKITEEFLRTKSEYYEKLEDDDLVHVMADGWTTRYNYERVRNSGIDEKKAISALIEAFYDGRFKFQIDNDFCYQVYDLEIND